jgi:hypothetical protein
LGWGRLEIGADEFEFEEGNLYGFLDGGDVEGEFCVDEAARVGEGVYFVVGGLRGGRLGVGQLAVEETLGRVLHSYYNFICLLYNIHELEGVYCLRRDEGQSVPF